MSQYGYKEVWFEKHARKELNDLNIRVRQEVVSLIDELSEVGFLEYPDARKLSGSKFFEMRVMRDGYWRIIYAYFDKGIVVLNIFNKKTNRTPIREIEKAKRRFINC